MASNNANRSCDVESQLRSSLKSIAEEEHNNEEKYMSGNDNDSNTIYRIQNSPHNMLVLAATSAVIVMIYNYMI